MHTSKIIAAAVGYFLIVFASGWLFGPIRVFWVQPRLGETLAVLCEAPFLLAAMVLAARVVTNKMGLAGNAKALIATGVGALVLQQMSDVTLGYFVRGIPVTDQFSHFATQAGLVYLVLLADFAAMPLLLVRHTGG
jgi:hypothetical protein